MNVMKSIAVTTITAADTLTVGMVALNHLARAASERTVVIEQKSIQAAALSQLEGRHVLALRLQELAEQYSTITPELRAEADVFMDRYEERRSTRPIPSIVDVQLKSGKHKNKAAKSKENHAAE